MKNSTKILVFSAVIVGLCVQDPSATLVANDQVLSRAIQTKAANAEEKTQEEARRLWEQAITAKGGRKRLYAIQNILISQSANYKKQKFSLPRRYAVSPSKGNHVRTVALYVFPNKFWDCEDYRPDVFGILMHMYNYETGKNYVITLGEPHHPLEPIEPKETRESRTYGLVSYLLETTWLKPIPLRASDGKIGLRQFVIVQTSLNGRRVDFAFDRKTHLLAEVKYYSASNDKTYVTTDVLSDYTIVDGIQVPQTVIVDGTKYQERIQFDVEYDPEIFVKLPSLEAGLDAWRPKGKK